MSISPSIRFVSVLALVLSLTLIAAEARRGFSSSGSGSGSYDSSATTNSWDLSSTPDADCLTLYSNACADLTPAQIEEVANLTAAAQAANFTNHTDYVAASALGYDLSMQDGTQWADARNPGADNTGLDDAWNTDCNNSFTVTGGCDALTNVQFANIDDDISGRVPALTAGYASFSDWQTASALNYELDPDDAVLWTQAKNGTVSAAACDAEFPGRSCHQLTKSSFENAKLSNALLTAKIAKVTAGTLNQADLLTDLGLTLSSSALSSPLAAWQIDYLESVLPTGTNTTKADWQTTMNNYSTSTASAWYLWKIASSSDATAGTYSASNATTALFTAAGASSAVTGLGVTNTQIAAAISTSGFTSAPNETAMNNFLTEARGFADGTSYASVATATGNGWSLTNYLTAIGNGGWTSSSADATAFAACESNTDALSGGAGACTASQSVWTAVAAVASASSADAVTDTQLETIIAAGSVSNSAFGDLANLANFETDYIRDCMGSTVTANQVSGCVTGGTSTKLTTQKISGMITGDYSGTPSVADFEAAGLASADTASGNQNVITFLKKSVCGTNGTTSCSAALGASYVDASLVASKGSGSSTQTALVNYLKDALLEYNKAVIDTTPPPATASGASCGSISLNVPAVCKVNPAFSCTVESGWTMAANMQTISKNWGSNYGTVSAQITITRNPWWGGSAYSRAITTSATLSNGGSLTYSFHYNGGNHPGFSSDMDNCFDAGGQMLAEDNYSDAPSFSNGGWHSYQTYVLPEGNVNRDRAWWNSRSQGDTVGPTCGRYGCGSTDQCAGPASSSHYRNLYDINRYMASTCSNTSNDHTGNFVCVKAACN